jgi:integrase
MARGEGRLFRQKNSRYWWVAYFHKGKEIRESTKEADEKKARNFLKGRRDQIGADRVGAKRFLGPAQERVTFDELADNYKRDRELNGRRSSRWAHAALAHLQAFFTGERAVDITTTRIRVYAEARLKEKAAPGTVNRKLAVLRRMFSLALREERLSSRPYMPKLKEAAPRQGFLEHAEYLAIRAHLPPRYQDVMDFGYYSGWRRSEIVGLEWRDVERASGVIRLRLEMSKNDEGRELHLAGPMKELIERRWQGRALGCPLVFHVKGRPIGDWRKTWPRRASRRGSSSSTRRRRPSVTPSSSTICGAPWPAILSGLASPNRSP